MKRLMLILTILASLQLVFAITTFIVRPHHPWLMLPGATGLFVFFFVLLRRSETRT